MRGLSSESKGSKLPIKPIIGLIALLAGVYILLQIIEVLGYNSFQLPPILLSILLILAGLLVILSSMRKSH